MSLLFYSYKLQVSSHFRGNTDCSARTYKMGAGNRDVNDVFAKQIDANGVIRSKKKRPDCIFIHNYIA